ncbi:hypothetical protein OIU74_009863 [Salix koriyanagi]|uniref:Uncharacterized protein n=1 Tax=Salix koriyanagi TaxID=2511006 RepID=A0A9Q0QL01_9ROSI|nr:hypothetical protein OIU74_009863 [Salix koriyanagi]
MQGGSTGYGLKYQARCVSDVKAGTDHTSSVVSEMKTRSKLFFILFCLLTILMNVMSGIVTWSRCTCLGFLQAGPNSYAKDCLRILKRSEISLLDGIWWVEGESFEAAAWKIP